MTEEQQLPVPKRKQSRVDLILAQIEENHQTDDVLLLADWLEEHGDERCKQLRELACKHTGSVLSLLVAGVINGSSVVSKSASPYGTRMAFPMKNKTENRFQIKQVDGNIVSSPDAVIFVNSIPLPKKLRQAMQAVARRNRKLRETVGLVKR